MSKRRNNRRPPSQPKPTTAVLERDEPQESRVGRIPQIRPGGQNFVPVTDNVIASMYSHMGPQKNVDTLYAPGAPIRPIPGLLPPDGPRVWAYPAGFNIAQLPRATEQYSFADLRALASMYDGVQMCQQVWFDYVSRLELAIEPREELIDEDMDISVFQDDILKYIEFFSEPDKELNFHEWLCKAVHEQLEIDALSIYVRKDRAGRPFSLDILDGSMIKPLIDDRGRRPLLPYPAYEQYWHGLPAAFLTSDDLLYIKETQRSDSVYGRSRVERIILRVNQALRKETKDLARFTDGNVPAGVIEVAMDVQWSQEEIEAYEIQFNNLMAGNDEQRARIKIMPRGFVYKRTDDEEIHIDLDQFILTHTAACHGLTLDELAMTANSNRSVGQSQENVVYRRAMGPLMGRYAKLLTHILRKFFREQRFVVKLRGYEEKEDFNTMAGAYATLTAAGIQSPTQAARAMHLPVWQDIEVPPFVMTKTGPIMIDDLANPDLRKAQMDAQMAGLELAKNNPGGKSQQEDTQNNDTEEGDEEDNGQSGNSSTGSKSATPGKGAGKPASPGNGRTAGSERAVHADLDRRSTDGMQDGQGGECLHSAQSAPLTLGETTDGVTTGKRSNQALGEYGIWRKGTCTCSACQVNDGVVRKAGDTFPSGATSAHQHDGCDCTIEPATQREEESPAVQRLMAEVAAILKRLDEAENTRRPEVLQQHTGMMLAFMLDEKTAKQLALPGGEPANILHITLAYLGDTEEQPEDTLLRPHTSPFKIRDAISMIVSEAKPLTGTVGGIGRFFPAETEETPVIALVDVPGLVEFRNKLVQVIQAAGYFVAKDHGYTPHITLAYIDAAVPMPIESVPPLPLTLDSVDLCVGDTHTRFFLGEEQYPQPEPVVSERDVALELNRWKDRAVDDMKRSRAFRGFTTTIIPEEVHTRIEAALLACDTVDAVRDVFRRAKEGDIRPFVEAAESGGHQTPDKNTWNPRW